MTGLIITLSIIAFFVFLLSFSLSFHVHIKDEVHIKFYYMCFKFWDSNAPKKESKKPKKKKVKKEKKSKPKDEEKDENILLKIENMKKEFKDKLNKIIGKKAEPTNEEAPPTKEKKSFTQTIYLILDLIKIVLPNLKKLGLGIKLEKISINMSIGQSDAHKTAMAYTLAASTIQNTIVYLKEIIRVQVKQIDIRPDFTTEEIHQDIFFKVKIPIFVILRSILGIIKQYIMK